MKKLICSMYFLLSVFSTSFAQKVIEQNFKKYYDKHNLKGSFLLYNLKKNEYTAYDYKRCQVGFIPASTFKIPNSLIGLDLGIVEDENSMFKWDGTVRTNKNWNKDMNLAEAMKVSCVPCYQQIARKVGVDKYHQYLTKFGYGKMDVNPQNLDKFWLGGKSAISQKQQVEFLIKLYKNELPVKKHSADVVKKIILLEDNPTYKMRGKTGWAIKTSDGINADWPDGLNRGWFVGWIEKGDNVYFFANNVEAMNPNDDVFMKERRGIVEAILKDMKIIE